MPCTKAFSGELRSLVIALSTATRGRLVETCCARAASGHAAAAPPSSAKKSRRFTAQYLPCSGQSIAQHCCAAGLQSGLCLLGVRLGRPATSVTCLFYPQYLP